MPSRARPKAPFGAGPRGTETLWVHVSAWQKPVARSIPRGFGTRSITGDSCTSTATCGLQQRQQAASEDALSHQGHGHSLCSPAQNCREGAPGFGIWLLLPRSVLLLRAGRSGALGAQWERAALRARVVCTGKSRKKLF